MARNTQTGGTLHLDEQLKGYARANVLPWEAVAKAIPGTITGTNMSRIRKACGLDWEPCTEPQFRRIHVAGHGPDAVYDYQEPKLVDGAGERSQFKYVTKGPGGPILDSANGTYNLFGNGEMFDVAEAIGTAGLELGRTVTFVAGGEIRGGRKVFLLADLGVHEIKGDPSPHVRFMGLLNGHDGTASLKVIGTDLRWTCTNMIHAAEVDASARGTAFSFRHTSRIASRVERAMDAIKATMFQLNTVDAVTEKMIARKVSKAERTEYINQFALARVISKSDPHKKDSAEASPNRAKALEATVGGITHILGTPTCEGIRDSAYGLFAATVEFLDHHRAAKTTDGIFTRSMIDTQPDKQLARRVLYSVI